MKKSKFSKNGYEGYKVKIKLVREGRDYEKVKINNPEDAYKFIKDALETSDRERFIAIYLDAKNRVIGVDEISTGGITAAAFYPREIVKGALLSNAVSIIIAHNHPSGDPTPSSDDINVTTKIKEACSLLQIELSDHIIVGDGQYFSFLDKGYL